MSTEKKMDAVILETMALLAYMDERRLKADVGISVLASALAMSVKVVGLPMEIVTDSLLEMQAKSMFGESQVVH